MFLIKVEKQNKNKQVIYKKCSSITAEVRFWSMDVLILSYLITISVNLFIKEIHHIVHVHIHTCNLITSIHLCTLDFGVYFSLQI